MPVLLDSSSQNIVQLSGTATSGSLSGNHTVNPLAPLPTVTLFAFLDANVATTGATLSATFGGTAMTAAGSPVYFDSNESVLVAFTLANPPTGSRQWVVTLSGLTANTNGAMLMAACDSYSGVLSVGTPVTVSGASAGATTSNSVTVDSVSAAYRVVTAHAVSSPESFSAYNATTRNAISGEYAYIAYLLDIFGFELLPYNAEATGGELLVGDAPGAAAVTGTATQPSTALWGAIGLPLVPAPVVISGGLAISTDVSVSASLTRTATPSPLRTWVIRG